MCLFSKIIIDDISGKDHVIYKTGAGGPKNIQIPSPTLLASKWGNQTCQCWTTVFTRHPTSVAQHNLPHPQQGESRSLSHGVHMVMQHN